MKLNKEGTKIIFKDQQLTLLPQKAIYWEEEEALLIADLHLGKVAHFRKSGIPVPPQSEDKNWQTLSWLIRKWSPKKLIILGDLFHSKYNEQWENFILLTERYNELEWILVKGNHDVLRDRHYERSNLTVHEEILKMKPFLFTHEPEEVEEGYYTLCGHIHPGIRFMGAGRQSVRVPCFFLGSKIGILPAFGVFTGLYTLSPEADDEIYVIVEDQVLQIATTIEPK